jgi:hypothetical protein
MDLIDESGAPLPTYEHAGRRYVLGVIGQRYLLRVRNGTGERIEVVASVDGRDVVDGQSASWNKRGYIVDPYGTVTIDGYRLSREAVAAFRFSSVPRSYAAQMGSARDVGVVGVAVFTERRPISYWPGPLRRYGSAPKAESKTPDTDEAPGNVGSEPASPPAPDPGALSQRPIPRERPGLGTEFAEEHRSHVDAVRFDRQSSTPAAALTARYNDRAGLLALGIDVDGRSGWYSSHDGYLRESAEPFRRNASFAQPPPRWQR